MKTNLIATFAIACMSTMSLSSYLVQAMPHGGNHSHGSSMADEMSGEHHGDMHDPLFHHGSIEVSAATPTPSVTVIVHPDTRKGWNLEVQTENFTFTPEQINQTNQPNVGHGHLYVDGVKVTRLYGNWYYLENLESGSHEVTVSLHANSHEVWMVGGEAIAHTVTIEVP